MGLGQAGLNVADPSLAAAAGAYGTGLSAAQAGQNVGAGQLGAAGAATDLASYMMPSGLRWRYTQAPQVTSIYRGISNVSCSFVACLDSP